MIFNWLRNIDHTTCMHCEIFMSKLFSVFNRAYYFEGDIIKDRVIGNYYKVCDIKDDSIVLREEETHKIIEISFKDQKRFYKSCI